MILVVCNSKVNSKTFSNQSVEVGGREGGNKTKQKHTHRLKYKLDCTSTLDSFPIFIVACIAFVFYGI